MMKRVCLAVLVLILSAAPAVQAKIDLVTLPTRDKVQMTIYNSADLTLIRESRTLTLKKGLNRLQFSWAGTLIDPTSLELTPLARAADIHVQDLVYPPRVRNLGLWGIESAFSGQVPVEITYLTSGLSWRAFYMGTLDAQEKSMRLEGYVRVTNASGEDYENARTRVIVGRVHLLDRIADLARRTEPYGRPGRPEPMEDKAEAEAAPRIMFERKMAARVMAEIPARPKEITKEGLSEYFLYTIEGTETIPDGWSKRLPSFTAESVPVVNLYKYEEEKYGPGVVRFISFKNDDKHRLGQTPIPGGTLRVYRNADQNGHLAYEGRSEFKYIPVGEDVELNLGPMEDVIVEPKMMEFSSGRHQFDDKGNVSGWEEVRRFTVTVKNTRPRPINVEIRRNLGTPYWTLDYQGQEARYEKVDLDTVQFTLTLPERSKREFTYVLTTRHGRLAE